MNRKIKIIADDKIPFLQGVLEPFANIEYYPGKEITNYRISDADVLIIRTRTKCNKELLEGTRIKLIATATIGFDHIDTIYCKENEIKWLNAPGCNSGSVMQYITAALIQVAAEEEFNLSEKTIGIIGVGNVGQKVHTVAEVLGMNVLLNDPPRERIEGGNAFCDLERIKNESDIISFHVPLNREGADKTYHLADDDFFNQLIKKPTIINSSRGEVIKTSSLIDAIKSNKINKTVIDVWENEPDINLKLLDLVDIATPHIAGYSIDGKANGTAVCVNAVNKYFNLGLEENWYPSEIPIPDDGIELCVNGNKKEVQDIISEVVNSTYNMVDDNMKFKESPDTFEKQRGNYPVRREFFNYIINLHNCDNIIPEMLDKMNFKINFN